MTRTCDPVGQWKVTPSLATTDGYAVDSRALRHEVGTRNQMDAPLVSRAAT
jgi:hypothetical protein